MSECTTVTRTIHVFRITPSVLFTFVYFVRIDVIGKQVDDIVETSFIMQTEEKEATQVQLPPVLEERLDYLEQQVREGSVWLRSNNTKPPKH